MITSKEFESYLKVKDFMEKSKLEEIDLILEIVGFIPLIMESYDMELKKFYSLSTAAKEIGVLKQTIDYAYRNKKLKITRRRGRFKVF